MGSSATILNNPQQPTMDDEHVESGAQLRNPGRRRFPAMIARPGRRPDRQYSECGPTEDVRLTPAGWKRVDRALWSMSSAKALALEPGFVTALQRIAISMIPPAWPDWVKREVEEAIMTTDPRLSVSHQKIYRDFIYGLATNGQIPQLIALWACLCICRNRRRINSQLRL